MSLTPRDEAIIQVITMAERRVHDEEKGAESGRDRAVIKHLKKLVHQLRKKIKADPVYTDIPY